LIGLVVEKKGTEGEFRGEVEPEKERWRRGEGDGPPMSIPIARPCGSSVGAEVRMREGRRFPSAVESRSSPRRMEEDLPSS
jgi:hypothetical protein